MSFFGDVQRLYVMLPLVPIVSRRLVAHGVLTDCERRCATGDDHEGMNYERRYKTVGSAYELIDTLCGIRCWCVSRSVQ